MAGFFDVEFRTTELERLRTDLDAMTRGHFDLLEHLAATKPWDLLMRSGGPNGGPVTNQDRRLFVPGCSGSDQAASSPPSTVNS